MGLDLQLVDKVVKCASNNDCEAGGVDEGEHDPPQGTSAFLGKDDEALVGLGSQKTVGQTTAMTRLADLATGEMARKTGNDHEVPALQKMGDFLMGALQMVYA